MMPKFPRIIFRNGIGDASTLMGTMNDVPSSNSTIGRICVVFFGVVALVGLTIVQDVVITGRLMLRLAIPEEERDAKVGRNVSTLENKTAETTQPFPYDSRAAVPTYSLCTDNPYAPSLNNTLDEIAKAADIWLESVPRQLVKARNSTTMSEHTHERFFPFDPISTCEHSCVGGPCGGDKSKIACGVETLQDGCVIYSIGGNNNWRFELHALQMTPCQVHTFDCTGDITRFQKPENDRLFFHHVCLGHEYVPAPQTCERNQVCGEVMTIEGMQKRLEHKRIDLLKMDIEGFEWPIFESWSTLLNKTSLEMVLPYQVLVEIHYQTQFKELSPDARLDFKSAEDMVMLQERLLRMGYATIIRDDNRRCKHCSELTLLRFRCPNRMEPNVHARI